MQDLRLVLGQVGRQPLGVPDVAGRLPDPARRVLPGVAEAIVEALPVELDLAGVVPAGQARLADRFVQGCEHPESRASLRRPLRLLAGPCQHQGGRGPLGRSPGLLRGIADVALGEQLQGGGLKVPGVLEELLDAVCHGRHGALRTAKLTPSSRPRKVAAGQMDVPLSASDRYRQHPLR